MSENEANKTYTVTIVGKGEGNRIEINGVYKDAEGNEAMMDVDSLISALYELFNVCVRFRTAGEEEVDNDGAESQEADTRESSTEETSLS